MVCEGVSYRWSGSLSLSFASLEVICPSSRERERERDDLRFLLPAAAALVLDDDDDDEVGFPSLSLSRSSAPSEEVACLPSLPPSPVVLEYTASGFIRKP